MSATYACLGLWSGAVGVSRSSLDEAAWGEAKRNLLMSRYDEPRKGRLAESAVRVTAEVSHAGGERAPPPDATSTRGPSLVRSAEYGTYLRKGEKASLVVFYRELEFAREDAKPAVFEYIEVFYNRERLHSAAENLGNGAIAK